MHIHTVDLCKLHVHAFMQHMRLKVKALATVAKSEQIHLATKILLATWELFYHLAMWLIPVGSAICGIHLMGCMCIYRENFSHVHDY